MSHALAPAHTHVVHSTRPQKVAVLLLLAPHPSILYVLLNYHYLTLHAPAYFIAHLLVIYTLSFLAFSSLIACVARDPGPIPEPKSEEAAQDTDGAPASGSVGDELSLQDALLTAPSAADDYTQPGKWCRVCWRPKPERAHHCSQCGRCVLKMGACGVSCRFVLPQCSCFLSTLGMSCVQITTVPGWVPNALCAVLDS